MTTRRQVLGTLGALATTRRDAAGYDLGDVEAAAADQGVGWASLGDLDVDGFGADVTGAVAGAALDADETADAAVEVAYSDDAVYLLGEAAAALDDVDGSADARTSAATHLSSDQARELAGALYQAAEERDAALDAANAADVD